jgi:serine/threonine protein kinase
VIAPGSAIPRLLPCTKDFLPSGFSQPKKTLEKFNGLECHAFKGCQLRTAPIAEDRIDTERQTPGAFAGTPEFASPEQFARVPVDIRSDLYSLGSKENKLAQRPALPRLEKN